MKVTLYDLIAANKALKYIDPVQDKSFSITDFYHSIAIPSRKGLAFLYLDNSIASVEVLLNFLQSQWAVCLLSPKMNVANKAQLEAAYKPGYIYDPARDRVADYDPAAFSSGTGLFQRTHAIDYTIHPAIKLLLSTSGSTGSPKMVKLSEENLVQNALSILDYLPVQNSDITPLNLPLFYSYGLSVFTTNSIAGGSILCTSHDIVQQEFWESWKKYGCTSLAGVPYSYEMLLRFGLIGKTQPSLRYMTQAGGKMSTAVLQQMKAISEQYGFSFFAMYGQTEATARMSWLGPEELADKAGSIGKPIKNGVFSIDPLSGELLYSGPNVFGGYAESYAGLDSYEQPGVLHTGDIAEQDDEGYYYITGRMKRFVKLFGTRINLDDIEQLLKEQFPGKTLMCLGNKDQHLLVMHVHEDLDGALVKQFLSSRLSVHPNVIRVQIMEKFPLTSNGKPDYTAAAALVSA